MTKLSINEIRETLTSLEDAFSVALDDFNVQLAAQLGAKRDQMWDMLVAAIQAEDFCTTEADIRFFESNG